MFKPINPNFLIPRTNVAPLGSIESLEPPPPSRPESSYLDLARRFGLPGFSSPQERAVAEALEKIP